MSDDHLYDLVIEWDERRQQGEDVSLDLLCEDRPELLSELEDCIASVKETDWMLHSDDEGDDFLSLPDFDTVMKHVDETQLPTSTRSAEQFAQAVVESGLLTVDDVASAQNLSSANDAESLARELVSKDKLTTYQASVLLEGRSSPLMLDRYVILDTLDRGGMGLVFKALHRSLDRIVALKTLPPAAVDSPDKVKRFQREAKAAAKLDHANIVTTHDAHESDGIHFLVMEYVKGKNLNKVVTTNGPQPVGKAVNYVLQAARGLEHAHKQGIIHRDIKPANLLLDENGVLKILDMGLARIESSGDEDKTVSQELTMAGTVMGTVAYMAPEQALDTSTADHRSDIYSLGCTLHFLLTGHTPYRESTPMKTLKAHRESPIPSLCDTSASGMRQLPGFTESPAGLRPPLAEVDAVFRKMLAKDPWERYQSATEVIAALEAMEIPADATGPMSATAPEIGDPNTATVNSTVDLTASRQAGHAVPDPVSPVRVHRTRLYYTAVGAALLAGVTLAVLYFAGVIFKVKTPEGTLVIEVDNPKNVVVEIDGRTADVKLMPDGKRLQIAVKPGTRQLVVKTADGTILKTNGDRVEIAAGKTRTIKAWLLTRAESRQITGRAESRQITGRAETRKGPGPRHGNPPLSPDWVQQVARLPADKQARAVKAELLRRNPGFKGQMDWKTTDGKLTGWLILVDRLNDLSPLLALSHLKTLEYDRLQPRADAGVLREITTLETINGYSAATYRLAYPKHKPPRGEGVTEEWIKQVRALRPEKRVKVVMAKIRELNPNFDGKYTREIKGGSVTLLTFAGTVVTDITPLQVLNNLELLKINSTGIGNTRQGWLADLSPLKGMPLTNLNCEATQVADLSPLKGMRLTLLQCGYTQVSDLSPLKGMPLTDLNCNFTRVSNLSPLTGMPLTALHCGSTRVADLSPLKGMPLTYLYFDQFSPENLRIVRGIKTLKTIKNKPAAAFWKEMDAKKNAKTK